MTNSGNGREAIRLVTFATKHLDPNEVYSKIGYNPAVPDLAYGVTDIVTLEVLKRGLDISTGQQATDIFRMGVRDINSILRTDLRAHLMSGHSAEEAENFIRHPETMKSIASIALKGEKWGEEIQDFIHFRETAQLPQEYLPMHTLTPGHDDKEVCPYAKHVENNPTDSKFSQFSLWSGRIVIAHLLDTSAGITLGESAARQKARKSEISSYSDNE